VTRRGDKYGGQHKMIRRLWAERIRAGDVPCVRCGEPIIPDPTMRGGGWELDHADDGNGYLGPSHRHCNRLAGWRRGYGKRGMPPPPSPSPNLPPYEQRW
jgi:hypothetical protein